MLKVDILVRLFWVGERDVNKGGTARVIIACRLLIIETMGFFYCQLNRDQTQGTGKVERKAGK